MSQTAFTGKVSQMKPDAKWLASEDFIGLGEVEFEIAQIFVNSNEIMQDGKKKDFFSVGFVKTNKQLVLNSTNRKTHSGQRSRSGLVRKCACLLRTASEPSMGELLLDCESKPTG